jgi:hypothetical protein
VFSGYGGKYFFAYVHLEKDTILPPDTVFSTLQREGEPLQNLKERAQKEARRRGISCVDNLD